MAIELQDIVAIADKVNDMEYARIRVRMKALEAKYNSMEPFTFTDAVELQYLLLKIIPR